MLVSLSGIFAAGAAGGGGGDYDWTSRSMASTGALRGVAYDGSSYWVAVTSDGNNVSDIVTSTNAITWAIQASNKNSMRDIGSDGTTWVTVGDAGYMLSATNPNSTWTPRTSSFGSDNIAGVFYDGTTYWFAMGANGKIATATSPTGTWSQQTTNFGSNEVRSCAFDGTTYCIVGGGGKMDTATDPTGTWTPRTSSFVTGRIRYIAYSPHLSLWCAVGNDGKIATASSATGTWYQRSNPFGSSEIITTVQWDSTKNRFVAVGNDSTIAYSTNGTSWSTDTGGFSNMWDLYYGDGFLIVVGDGGKIATSFS